ncbi:MAG: CBS domain-containing protein [Vulcanibacillus sp.]
MEVSKIMTTDVETVTLRDNAYEVAKKMERLDVGAIPVVDEKRIVGMITDRDLVIRGYAKKLSGSTSVEELMSKDVIVGTPDMSIDDAASIMADKQIRRLPIVENGMMVGIVSIGDLAIRNDFSDEAAEALTEISKSSSDHVM